VEETKFHAIYIILFILYGIVVLRANHLSFIITPKAAHKIQYNLKVHWYNECKDKNTHTNMHTYME